MVVWNYLFTTSQGSCGIIEDKSHESIIPVISRHVEHGAQINSDGANVYKCLSQMHFTHHYVIHEREFVTNNGIHTNYIENFWANLKMYLKSVRGSQKEMLDGHIDEYVYRYNRKGQGSIFTLILQDIAQIYPL